MRKTGWLIFILMFLVLHSVKSQETDSIRIKGGSYVVINNSLVFFAKDTILVIPVKKQRPVNNNNVYDQLHQMASGNRISRELYNLLFRYKPLENSQLHLPLKAENARFTPWQGKIINQIEIIQPPVFDKKYGDSLLLFSQMLYNTGNYLHINTRKKIIYNNLLIKTGDTIQAYTLSDNERILRRLPYIEDARFIITYCPYDSSMADITIVVKDVWSAGAEILINDTDNGYIDVFDKNLLGLGHLQQNRFMFNTHANPKTGYEGLYRINNIGGSFINSKAGFMTFGYDQSLFFEALRGFVTPETRYAGGFSFSNSQKTITIKPDLTQKVNYVMADIWAGQSLKLYNYQVHPEMRPQIIFKSRFTNQYFSKRPEVFADSNYRFMNFNRFLFSIDLRQQSYLQNNYIVKFGPTEDFITGFSAEYTMGYQTDDFGNRWYNGISATGAGFFRQTGYFSAFSSLSGWLYEQKPRQIIFHSVFHYYTPMIYAGIKRTRFFLNLHYTNGWKLNKDEFITINNQNGIRDFSASSLSGTQRMGFRFENVWYPRYYYYGFGMAFFIFCDGAYIGKNNLIQHNNFYSALGTGLRIRNENLVFNSFEIRLAYYPHLTKGIEHFSAYFSNVYSLGFPDFNNGQPNVQEF